MTRLADPRECPLLSADDLVGVLPLKRSALYEAIHRGEIPSIRYGRRFYVVNAELQRQLGLSPETHAGTEPASSAAATSLDRRQEDKVVRLHDDTTPAA